MVAPIAAFGSSARWTAALRWLGLPFLCLLLLVAAAPAASQDGEELPPYEAAPPREAAVLAVTVSPRPDLSADLGEPATVPAVVTNTGNIAALGVVVSAEDAGLLEGTPVNVGDLAPGAQVALELPVVVVGRSAFPLPFAARATAANVEYPAIATAEQTFAPPDSSLYLPGLNRTRVLLEYRRERYDADNPVGRTLLWVELSNPNLHDRPSHINLRRLLHGSVPADLTLRVLYYPTELSTPQELPVTYNPAGTRLDLVLPGPGRYLIEWVKGEAVSANEVAPPAAAATEPDLPQGWTPSYHAPLVSEFTGSVTLQYPILTPPGAAGLQPNLGLSYSSANGNGMMGRLQADETGFGWTNNALIDVTQALDVCQTNVCEGLRGDKDGNPQTNDPYNQYTLSFGGVGYELIHAGGKAFNGEPGRYYAQGNAGLYVELCKAPLSEYCQHLSDVRGMTYTTSNVVWRITGADGTTYRLGGTANSEQGLIVREPEEDEGPPPQPNARNKALRWRVDTVVDRFGNIMEYKYIEEDFADWIHPEYLHAEASYLDAITYDAYTIDFIHNQLPYGAYREQGYGHSISYQTHYLGQVKVMTGTQQIRHYSLGYDYQRYGVDNDTDHPPQDTTYAFQSPWCAAYNHVLDFKNGTNKDDNVAYAPNKLPLLLTIHEGGRDGSAKSMNTPDTTFRYVYLGTGQYDHAAADPHVRYCFPYLDTVETLYGPVGDTPTTEYAWRDENSANAPTQSYGGLLRASYLGRYVNTVEREMINSGFALDAPAIEKYYTYSSPNFQGDDDTFQGFITVNRCEGAVCSGAWTRKTTLHFLANLYYLDTAALTGRTDYQEVRAHPDSLMARTEYAWGMLDADGVNGMDPTRVAVLTQQIERDYRGGEVATRTKFVYDVYGNRTQTQEFGQTLTGNTPKRTLERLYTVNTNAGGDDWLVNLAWRETLWDGLPNESDASKIVRRARFRYDGATCGSPSTTPTRGQLTAEDHYLDSGGNSPCGATWVTTSYTYHATRKWQVTQVTDPTGRYKTYAWTDTTQLASVTTAVDGVNLKTSYTYDAVFRWQVSAVTQPNGAKTQYIYDVHGRLREVKRPDPGTAGAVVRGIEYVYGDTSNPIYVEQKDWGVHAATPPTTHTFYDALGRPLQERHWNVSDDFTVAFIDTHYDSLGRVKCVTPLMSDTGAGGSFSAGIVCSDQAHTLYTYDVLDEQTIVKGMDGQTTETTVAGRERLVKDANKKTTTYLYDDLGRLVKVTQPPVAGGAPVMTYTYNLADDLVRAVDSDSVTTTMTYDKLGRKTEMNDPDMGLWQYGYDGSDNLVWQTNSNSQRLCFYYDDANRLTNKMHSGQGGGECPLIPYGTLLAGYIYYTSGPGLGLVETVSDIDGVGVDTFEDHYAYDYRGRVVEQTRKINNIPFTRATGYDAADRPLQVMYPSGEIVSYGYNGLYPKSLDSILPTPATTLVADLMYNQRGQLVWLARGPNATVPDTNYTYFKKENSFRLQGIQNGSVSDSLPDFTYTYDAVGQVTTLVTDRGATTETQTFGYDAAGRLTTAALNGAGTANYSYTYGYNESGNILSRTGTDPDMTYTYGTQGGTPAVTGGPHAVTRVDNSVGPDWNYDYDAQGNLDSKYEGSTVAYDTTFDLENRLTKVVKEAGANDLSAEFYYDADGNRMLTIYKTGTTETSRVYTPFPEYDKTIAGSVVTERSSYSIAGQLIAMRVKSGGSSTLYYAYTDHLGSVSAWLGKDANGNWVMIGNSLARYEPYGGYRTKPSATINPDISDRGFTGHRQNNTGANDLGLIYMNARYYLPEIGRFISADTIVPEPGNPQSFNRYSYVRNSPVNYTDPTGNLECIDTDCEASWNHAGSHAIMRGRVPVAIRYMHREMTKNASGPIAGVIRDANLLSHFTPAGKPVAYAVWTSQVMDASIKDYLGPLAPYFANWDHKPILNGKYGPPPVPEIVETRGWATVADKQYRSDIWSNIHYGYVGASAGFPSSEMIDGAGVEQVGTNIWNDDTPVRSPDAPSWLSSWDQPSDTASIQLGASLWYRYGLSVTPGDLYVAVTLEGWNLASRLPPPNGAP